MSFLQAFIHPTWGLKRAWAGLLDHRYKAASEEMHAYKFAAKIPCLSDVICEDRILVRFFDLIRNLAQLGEDKGS